MAHTMIFAGDCHSRDLHILWFQFLSLSQTVGSKPWYNLKIKKKSRGKQLDMRSYWIVSIIGLIKIELWNLWKCRY